METPDGSFDTPFRQAQRMMAAKALAGGKLQAIIQDERFSTRSS
jgi:hypothetical protein